MGMVTCMSLGALAIASVPLVQSGTVSPSLGSYLSDRLKATFGDGDEPGQLRVHLDGERRELSIEESGRTIARRPIPTSDEEAPTSWIFVRSTIKRAMVSPSSPPIQREVAMTPAPPLQPETIVVRPIEPPPTSPWSVHLLAGAQLADGSPSLGFRAGVDRQGPLGLRFGAQLGYRYGSPSSALERHGVPIAVRAAWAGAAWPVQIGVLLGAELASVSADRKQTVMLDVETGPYVETGALIHSGPSGELYGVIDLAGAIALRRGSYLLDVGTIDDGLWRVRLTAGLEWRWL
jgi:hypothetical protein